MPLKRNTKRKYKQIFFQLFIVTLQISISGVTAQFEFPVVVAKNVPKELNDNNKHNDNETNCVKPKW